MVAVLLALGYQHRLSVRIEARPPGASAHLLDLHHGDGHGPSVLEAGGVPDDHSSGGQVDPGGQSGGGDDALDPPGLERLLDGPPLGVCQSGIVERHSLGDARCELDPQIRGFGSSLEHRDLLRVERIGRYGCDGVGDASRLSLRRSPGIHEDEALAPVLQGLDDKRLHRVVLVRHLHGLRIVEQYPPCEEHALAQRDGTPVAGDQPGLQPVGYVPGVGYGGGEGDHLHVRELPHELGEGNLERGPPARVMDHVYLVRDDQPYAVDPSAPVADHRVRLLGGGDDDVRILESPVLGIQVARAHMDLESENVAECSEIVGLLRREGFQRNDVEDLAPLLGEHLESGHDPDEGLPAGGRYRGHHAASFQRERYGLRLGRMELSESGRCQRIGDGVGHVELVYPHARTDARAQYVDCRDFRDVCGHV